jgi:hypothetical protein
MGMTTAASPLPPEARAKLGKLLLMLSSTHDGERAAAAAAIERLLRANGCDLHDLVALINLNGGAGLASAPPPSPPSPSSSPSWQRTSGPTTMPRDQLLEILEIIEGRSSFLPIKSAEFVASLRERARCRPAVRLSERQWDWLQDLMQRSGV